MKKTDSALFLAGLLAVAHAAFLAIAFAAQPPLDLHAFRQTQTALTAYWFQQEGWRLAYETPVLGAPYAIPFEFPIFQAIVAGLATALHAPLDVVGRLTSFVFLLLCIVPARSITRTLLLPDAVLWLFLALLFTAPLYVYWGRAFMIETAALFFSLAAIACFLDYLLRARSARALLLFALFATLALLQKATTWLPAVPVLGAAYLGLEGKRSGAVRDVVLGRRALAVGAAFLLPIVAGWTWVHYTDAVKLLNPAGAQLTSSALVPWNFGSLEQRISGGIWTTVVWRRLLVQNLGGALGLFVLSLPFLLRTEARVRWIVGAALSLAILPLFVFTNLHLVHTYYQSANAIFLAFAAAVALGAVVLPRLGFATALLLLVLILVSNDASLDADYLGAMEQRFGARNRDVAIGAVLKREVPPGEVFVAFGNDWSPTFAYMAQRKSFTVPPWFKDYARVARAPERFVGAERLGAVVSCSARFPAAHDVVAWAAAQGRSWKVGETSGCVVAVPQQPMQSTVEGGTSCQGSIDSAKVETRGGSRMLSVAGWMAADPAGPAGRVFLSVSRPGEPASYFDTLAVPRPDAQLEGQEDASAGFSRLVSGQWQPGPYELGLVRVVAGQYRRCQLTKQIVVP